MLYMILTCRCPYLLVYFYILFTQLCFFFTIILVSFIRFFFFFQAEDGIRDLTVTGVQTCALPISSLVPPESLEGHSDKEIEEWRTEYDVTTTLRNSGHEVRCVGVRDSLTEIGRASCRERV